MVYAKRRIQRNLLACLANAKNQSAQIVIFHIRMTSKSKVGIKFDRNPGTLFVRLLLINIMVHQDGGLALEADFRFAHSTKNIWSPEYFSPLVASPCGIGLSNTFIMSTIEELEKRKISIPLRLAFVNKGMEDKFSTMRSEIERDLRNIMASEIVRGAKITRIQNLLSEVRRVAESYAACKSGCSNCCHPRVMLCQAKADVIGGKIGREAIRLAPDYVPAEEKHLGRLHHAHF